VLKSTCYFLLCILIHRLKSLDDLLSFNGLWPCNTCSGSLTPEEFRKFLEQFIQTFNTSASSS
jgi:hypothetical protein